jgi:Delta6-protoilludene synthase
MALFFIYDEFTDKVDGDGARLYADMVMDAIRNPHKERPQGEAKLGEIARQYVHVLVNVAPLSDDPGFDRFWLRALKISGPAAQTRFISSFSEYVYAVIDEASDRAEGNIRGIDDYLKLTRLTAGGYPAFVAVEASLNIPNEVMAHPALESLRSLAAESLVLTNVGISSDCHKYTVYI